MKNDHILFRTAGGKAKKKKLGLGHIYRTINLAKKFPRKNVFFLIEDYGGVKEVLAKHGFTKNVYTIKKNPKFFEDITRTKNIIKRLYINTIIVDKYHISRSYLKSIRKITKLVLICDLECVEFSADLLVNGFVGFSNQIRLNKHKTKCLLGPKYQILNTDFAHTNNNHKKFDILATFGGFDEKKISQIFTDSIERHIPKLKIKIILGPASSIPHNLKSLKNKYSSRITIIQQTRNMSREIENTKFGFCSGGITTYEFASKGIPFAIICDEKHQLRTAVEWEKRKCAINLGLVNSNSKEKIQFVIQEFLQNKIHLNKSSKITDGLGANRVFNEILKI